ncbi:MAG: hypothetical protein AAF652_09640 [Cyanobacteria bacterium P01_C01_bin.72]
MSDYQISLPENIYNSLLTEAEVSGVSPTEWIATRLSLEAGNKKGNYEKSDVETLLSLINSNLSSKQLSPAEKAQAFEEWAESHRHDTPPLSDEAISRESIYGDERL